jgi:N-acetylmuramoyl-L-alanine amidase
MFPAGGLPIPLRSTLAAVLAVTPIALLAASSEPIVVIVDQQRREIAPVVRGEAELVPLADLLRGLPVAQTAEARGSGVTLSAGTHKVTLYDRKSLASVDGDLRLLSSNVLQEGGRWLVPVDSVPRFLGPLLGKRAEWRGPQRTLLIGNVTVPRVTVRTAVSGSAVRVAIEASEKVPFRVAQEQGRVTVAIPRDVIDVSLQPERLTGGIVESVQFSGGKDNVFTITLGRRFKDLQAHEEEGPSRLVMDFQALPLAAGEPSPSPSASAAAPRVVPEGPSVRTVVIDPGHGGDDVGAKGPGGSVEKDVALAIARKVRATVANSLGLQAFLTRDKDVDVALDERAAFANNYKADLFISIHVNASRAQGARGSEVYFLSYQASDDESRRVAALEGGEIAIPAAAGAPAGSDVALILWDMAQAEHLEESSALASRIQEELAEVNGNERRGVKQAPFRVLVGAAMPAVLVEVAFISNSEEEKLLTSDAYQSRIAAAVARGIARFQHDQAQRTGTTSRETSPLRLAGPKS